MEREIWKTLIDRLDGLADRRPPRCRFTNKHIVRVYLWAALHDRPVCWACDPASWPGRRRRLPNPSTMSRRLRTRSVMKLLRRLLPTGGHGKAALLCIDGKPLRVSRFSKDRQATLGYAAGGFERGYKVHHICDRRNRTRGFDVRPMNEAESVIARKLITRAASRGALILGDAAYDSNELHARAASRGAALLAPRRKPGRGLGHHAQHEGRVRSIALLEGDRRKKRQAARLRSCIERGFGWLTGLGGGHLPPWVRTLPRVRRWILAKLVILDAARHPSMQ